MSARTASADVLLALGVLAELLCVLGVVWMRDALDRLHFAGAGTTVGPLLVGAAVLVNGSPAPIIAPPPDRYPAGGYRQAPAASRAWAAELTFGTMTPSQPRSSTRPISAG